MILTGKIPETEEEKTHDEKTIAVLDETVYNDEDFWISEQLQIGAESGANENILLGRTEYGIKIFHDIIDASFDEIK